VVGRRRRVVVDMMVCGGAWKGVYDADAIEIDIAMGDWVIEYAVISV
jgi:hypothetical protein